MEVSMLANFNDLVMNDLNFINQHQVNSSLEDIFGSTTIPCYGDYYNTFGLAGTNNNNIINNNNQDLLNCKRSSQTDLYHNNDTIIVNPCKKLKTDNWSSYDDQINHVLNSQNDHHSNNSSTMLSFTNSSNSSNQASSLITPKEEVVISNATFSSQHDQIVGSQGSFEKKSCILEARTQVDKKVINKFATSLPQHSRDHIIAERKRREKLSQRLIALSAIIPGLKKMDKATVLADAIKHVKQLQERVKKLEEEIKKKTVEAAVYVKRSYVSIEDDQTSMDTKCSSGSCDGQFPEIEAKFSDKDVLIRIICEKKQGVVEKVMAKIEELQLVVISSSSLAFGGSGLAVSIIAQMDTEFSITAQDLVRNLHSTLKQCLT